MRIDIHFRAEVFHRHGPERFDDLANVMGEHDLNLRLAELLDLDTAELGVVRGGDTLLLSLFEIEGRFTFRCPDAMSLDTLNGIVTALVRFCGQHIDEGILSDGVPFTANGVELRVAFPDSHPRTVTATKDGVFVPPASRIAIAARTGDADVVARLLAETPPPDLEQPLLGRTALQFAIRFGHASAAKLLLQAGANPNPPGAKPGELPLELCAASELIADDASRDLAAALLAASAIPTARAVEFAEARSKRALTELLASKLTTINS